MIISPVSGQFLGQEDPHQSYQRRPTEHIDADDSENGDLRLNQQAQLSYLDARICVPPTFKLDSIVANGRAGSVHAQMMPVADGRQ